MFSPAAGNYVAAAEILQKITHHNPVFANAFNNLADMLARLQQYEEALVAAKKAINLGGEHNTIYLQTLSEIEQLLTAKGLRKE